MTEEADTGNGHDHDDHDDHDGDTMSDAAGSTTDLEAVLETVRRRIEPDDDERTAIEATTETLVERAESALEKRCPDGDVIVTGSTARDTWVSGERDIDIFVRIPPDEDRETLETIGLAVGHATLPAGHEEYAEHPYVSGSYDGFDVDVVPCFRLERATDIRSSVDRTPFHTQYVRRNLTDERATDVRLAKQFMAAIGVYGSDLRTSGFSGYLTELLVLTYDGFLPFLRAAADWHPPVILDPEDHGETVFDDPLVVIDPTDPNRNVAAVCSAANVARLQHYAREFLTQPSVDHFEVSIPPVLSEADCRTHLDRRDTTPIAIRFDTPPLVDDQLYPQLRRTRTGIVDALDARGFDVMRSAAFANDAAVVLLELTVAERPAVERHVGPPVHVRDHAEGFYSTYVDDEDVYGPFIDGDRYVAERPREFQSAVDLLDSDALFDVRLGSHVETALEDGYDVLVGDELCTLCSTFGIELARYFDPIP